MSSCRNSDSAARDGGAGRAVHRTEPSHASERLHITQSSMRTHGTQRNSDHRLAEASAVMYRAVLYSSGGRKLSVFSRSSSIFSHKAHIMSCSTRLRLLVLEGLANSANAVRESSATFRPRAVKLTRNEALLAGSGDRFTNLSLASRSTCFVTAPEVTRSERNSSVGLRLYGAPARRNAYRTRMSALLTPNLERQRRSSTWSRMWPRRLR